MEKAAGFRRGEGLEGGGEGRGREGEWWDLPAGTILSCPGIWSFYLVYGNEFGGLLWPLGGFNSLFPAIGAPRGR